MRRWLLLLALVSYPCHAMTGNEWLAGQAKESYSFTPYLVGVHDGMVSYGHMADVCMPAGVTNSQLAAVFKKYLESAPEHTQADVPTLLWLAEWKAWPCPPKK